MKTLMLIAGLALVFQAQAQTVDVKDMDANQEGSTTIEITKGKKTVTEEKKNEAIWETQEGTDDIEGEAGATNKDGKAQWKKACDDWKKEFKENNKENKIISMACGSMSCSGDAGNKICTSKATYKIKTKMN